ncbi:oxidoreductase [Streptomyces sp. NBC_01635]|uniref:beta/gamma crystallin domain-containing protein n=1 Tax=Streptomyces sp. NBC_01635 TaxID=2975904 RepID=UPI00386D89FC|nr:oxidoreductase [Streptomyces sp. NBC_01635]WTD79536.1 oxidoreductase [Streptomyces sp. NBC_01635]
MPTIRKTAQRLFAVALLTAGLNLATPANTALAMNQTPCTTGDLLHMWGHYSRPLIVGPSGPFEFCAANAGTMGLGAGAWVDKISTGNNDIQMNDANGTPIRISRWNIVTYPNRPPNITSIQIF